MLRLLFLCSLTMGSEGSNMEVIRVVSMSTTKETEKSAIMMNLSVWDVKLGCSSIQKEMLTIIMSR